MSTVDLLDVYTSMEYQEKTVPAQAGHEDKKPKVMQDKKKSSVQYPEELFTLNVG